MALKKLSRSRKAAKIEKAPMDSEVRLRLSARDKTALLAAAERERLDFSSWARRVLLREAGAMPGTTT
jgi:hypothetical protein